MKYFAALGVALLLIAAASVGPWAPSPFTSQTGTNTTAAAWRTALGAAASSTLSGYVTNHTGAATNLALTGGSVTTQTNTDLTASRVVVSSAAKVLASSSVTSTTLGYLDATSSVQTQLDSKPTVALTNVARLDQSQTLAGAITATNASNILGGDGSRITGIVAAATNSLAMNQNQFDTTSTNIKSGATFTNIVVRSGSGGIPIIAYGSNGTTYAYVDKDGNFRASSGTASLTSYAFDGSVNSGMYYVASGPIIAHSGSKVALFNNGGVILDDAIGLFWSTDPGVSATDTAIKRLSAGLLELNTGTTGAQRDLRLRTVELSDRTNDPAASVYGQVYAKDVAGTTEVFVMDEAGNVTQISPHARGTSPAPAAVDAGNKTPIVIHHKNVFTGEQEWLHLSAMARKLEQLTGEKFVWKSRIPAAEVRDWDAEQARLEAESDDEVKADRKRLREWERSNALDKGAAPTVREKYRRAPKPDFLK